MADAEALDDADEDVLPSPAPAPEPLSEPLSENVGEGLAEPEAEADTDWVEAGAAATEPAGALPPFGMPPRIRKAMRAMPAKPPVAVAVMVSPMERPLCERRPR